MLDHKAITTSSFITNNNKVPNVGSMNMSSLNGENNKDGEGMAIMMVNPEEMWKRLV